MKNRKLDAGKMMRDIRNKLSKKYNRNPEAEEKDMAAVRRKYGLKITLEYRKDGNRYVGRLKEVPGVFSQGKTLKELKENIKDAYALVIQENLEMLSSKRLPKEIQKARKEVKREKTVSFADVKRKLKLS